MRTVPVCDLASHDMLTGLPNGRLLGYDAETLLQHSDDALHLAKQPDRNKIAFYANDASGG